MLMSSRVANLVSTFPHRNSPPRFVSYARESRAPQLPQEAQPAVESLADIMDRQLMERVLARSIQDAGNATHASECFQKCV